MVIQILRSPGTVITNIFFTWHRAYIRGLEEYLLDLGYEEFVPLPGWNPKTLIPDPFLEPERMVEEVYDTTYTYEVPNGTGFTVEMPLSQVEPDSLTMYQVDSLTCGQFSSIDQYAGFIRATSNDSISSHNEVHIAIDGAMGPTQTASSAAIFWLFHAYVDELYYCFKNECQGCGEMVLDATEQDQGCTSCVNLEGSMNLGNMDFRVFDQFLP